MLVMHVGHMRVRVSQCAMPVPVSVRFTRRIARFMHVLVMGIVHVRMRVIERFVGVIMLMMFGDVQPDAQAHERAGQ
jgi:hypothetical protein